MRYKKIDLKTYLDEQFLDWYNNEVDVYFLLLYENKIINSSENIEKLTDYTKNALIEKDISEIFKNENLNFLLLKLKTEKETNDYIFLPQAIKDKKLKVKWRRKTLDSEEVTFLLIKEVSETNIISQIEKVVIEREDINKDLLIPYAIIENDFIYKSKELEEIMLEESIYDYSNLIKWIKEKVKIDINETNLDSYCSTFAINNKTYLFYFKKIAEKKIIILSEFINYEFTKKIEELTQLLEDINKEKEELEKINENYKIEIQQIKTQLEMLQAKNEEFEKKDEDEKNRITLFVKNTTEEMRNLNELISMIEEISIKVHLISINAAIESARVGISGKGFSVIAKELEKLSELTKSYTKTLTHQINQITERIQQNIKKI